MHAKEPQAKISTPQDTLDARCERTAAKLEVMKLPPRRLKNQVRDTDFERLRHIFTGWKTCSTYWRATATVRRLQRRDKTKKHNEQAQRISDAWDQRDFKSLWSAARAMLSHPCGPKMRRYDIPLSSLPTAAAWATHLRQAGPLGGCLGTKVEWEAQLREARYREQPGVRWAAAEGFSLEPEELEQDFRGMVWRLRHSPLRRATPKWAAPGELWRQMVDPTRDNTPKKHGVGFKDQRLALFFQSRLWQGICRIRRAGWLPMWWHRSITFPIDKNNNKEDCSAVRLVNAFSPDSKAFYGYLWRRQPQMQQRSYASGCTAHRSRLEAIAQIVNIAERLRRAKISFVTTNYDVANAHPSPSHASLSEALVDTRHEDTGLLKQRHELATMEIQGADDSILIRPGSGTAQGSEGAADAFHRVYHKRIDKWAGHLQAELLQEALIFKAPPASLDHFKPSVFMGLTTYADDVRVTSITTEPVHTWSRVMANNAALDNALDEMAQNTAKQEHSVFFAGQGDRQYMAALNGTEVLPGTTGPVARYLGPHLDIMGSIRPELERRRAAAFRTWNRFRPVWFRAGIPLRVRRLFFSRHWWSRFCTQVWRLFT